MGTGPTPPHRPLNKEGEEKEEVQEGKVRKEKGETSSSKERLITPKSSPPPKIRNSNHQDPPDQDLLEEEQKPESLLEVMRKKRKNKEEVPVIKKTQKEKQKGKKLPDKKEEEAKKAAETMGKMMEKWKEVGQMTVGNKGSMIVDNLVQIDRKTVTKHDARKEDPEAIGRKKGTPRRNFQAVLRKFSTKDRVEETFEEWKKRKELVNKGGKRKAESDEVVYQGAVNVKGTPGKFRKMNPEKPKDIKTGKINQYFKTSEKSGGGGQVQLSRNTVGEVCSEVLGDGATHSPVLTQQRDMVGSEIIYPERIHAAVVMGKKTGSGGTAADSTSVQ